MKIWYVTFTSFLNWERIQRNMLRIFVLSQSCCWSFCGHEAWRVPERLILNSVTVESWVWPRDRKWYWWKTTLCRLEFSPPHQRRTVFVICTGFFLQERSKRCTPRVHVDQNVDVIWKSLNIPLEIQEKVSEIITPFHAHRPVGILTACHVPLRTYGFREY